MASLSSKAKRALRVAIADKDAGDAVVALFGATYGTGTASTIMILDSDGSITIPTGGDVVGVAVGTNDLGSAAYEWGNIYVADSKGVWLGTSQDASIIYDASNLLIESDTAIHMQIAGVNVLGLDDGAITAAATAETAGAAVYMAGIKGGTPKTLTSYAGAAVSFLAGAAGAATAGVGNAGAVGGAFTLAGGAGTPVGTVASGTANGGAGGAFSIAGGAGAAGGDSSGTDGAGGAMTVAGGASGTGANTGAAGGLLTLAGGASSGSGDTAGSVTIRPGAATGGTVGAINIGTLVTDELGFYGMSTTIARQTSIAITTTGIHAALVALGLITA